VTARVKLIFGRGASQSSSDISVATPEPIEKQSSRAGSGRYGIPSSCSDMSCSDDESDPEERSSSSSAVSSPTPSCTSRLPRSQIAGRLVFLRRILPPVHTSGSRTRSPSPELPPGAQSVLFDEAVNKTSTRACGKRCVKSLFVEERESPDHVGNWVAPNIIGAYPDSPLRQSSPLSDMQLSEGMPSPHLVPFSIPSSEPADGRAYSPANVSQDDYSEGCHAEESTGAHSSYHGPDVLSAAELDQAIIEYYSKPFDEEEPSAELEADIAPALPSQENGQSELSCVITSLNTRMDNTCNDLNKLRDARRADTDLFESRLREVKDRMQGLRYEMDVHVMTGIRANSSHMSEFNARLEDMQAHMERLKAHVEKGDREKQQDDTSDWRLALTEELERMRRETMQAFELHLAAITEARLEAERAIAASLVAAEDQLTVKTLKRKASELADVEGTDAGLRVSELAVAGPPKRRRVMKIVSGIGKTAAVATAGAVAAWTALAFA